jgi:amino-acid N-acetyltransferase
MPKKQEKPRKNEYASLIREVFGYIATYKGNRFVLKIEDTLLQDRYFPLLIQDIVEMQKVGIKVIIVPGVRRTIEKNLNNFIFKLSFRKAFA